MSISLSSKLSPSVLNGNIGCFWPSLLSPITAVMKHHDHKQGGEERLILAYKSPVTLVSLRNQGRNWCRRPRRLSSDFAPYGLLGLQDY